MKRMLKIVVKALLSLVVMAIAITFAMQGVTWIYEEPAAQPFAGENFYNPYAEVGPKQWKNGFIKANFHAHTRWDTRQPYTVAEFERAYQESGYRVVGISDHNILTTDLQHRPGYTPTYEHGWNLNNFHILMLGVDDTDLLDYPIMLLPRQQMQDALSRLPRQADVISVNHPERVKAVPGDVFSRLRGFRLMEINPDADTRFWDQSLSAGNYVTLVGGDDAHSIVNRRSWFQRSFTMVCPDTLSGESIRKALLAGRSYGVTVDTPRNLEGPHRNIPVVDSVALTGDTLSVWLSEVADSIRFIGDSGAVLASFPTVRSAQYAIPSGVSYVRISADMPRGIRFFLNPVARNADLSRPAMLPVPREIPWLTVVNTTGWSVLALLTAGLLIPLWRRGKRK